MSHADALLLGRKTWQIHGGAFEPMKPGRKILTDGSSVLVQTMAENDLVDEYSLWVYPVVLGGGKKVFPKRTPGQPKANGIQSSAEWGRTHALH